MKQKIAYLLYELAECMVKDQNLRYLPCDEFYRYGKEQGIWKHVGEKYLLKDITKHLLDLNTNFVSTSNSEEVLKHCKSLALVEEGFRFNQNKKVMVLQNGNFNLDDLELKEFDDELNSTIQLPVSYNPKATCPIWLKTLSTIFSEDQERIDYLQEVFAYCLYPSTEYHVAFFLYGSGKNGKTTVSEMIQEIVGDANCSNIPFEQLKNRFYLAELDGKLVNVDEEFESNGVSSTGHFKSLVSGGYMQADKKFKDPKRFKTFAKLIFCGNSLPTIRDRSYGFFRRVIVIPFDVKIEDADTKLKEKLMSERDGIFNWAVEGKKRLDSQGGFCHSDEIKRATKNYEEESNHLISFIEENCIMDVESRAEKNPFREAYTDWCRENGYRPFCQVQLTKELRPMNIGIAKSNHKRFFTGVKLRNSILRRINLADFTDDAQNKD